MRFCVRRHFIARFTYNLSIQHIYHLKALTDKRNVKPPSSGLFFDEIATFFFYN